MASYNRIVLVGNLTRDPEIRYLDGSGKAVTKFAIAVNRKTKGNEEAMFVDIVAWERLGEVCNQYLKKGMPVLVEGRLAIRNYETKEGEKRKAIEVVASDMQMLGSKTYGGDAPGGQKFGGGGEGVPSPGAAGGGFDDEGSDDEVPF